MKLKPLYILLTVLLVVVIVFNTSFTSAINIITNKLQTIANVSNSVAELSGADMSTNIPLYIPKLVNANNLGMYYDETNNTLIDVKDFILSKLPTWMKISDPEQCNVLVFPNYFSIVLNERYSDTYSDPFWGFKTDTYDIPVYYIDRCIRLYVQVYDRLRGNTINYDLFIFYDYKYNKLAFFSNINNNGIGNKSYKLDTYNQYLENIEKVDNNFVYPNLNSSYVVPLDIVYEQHFMSNKELINYNVSNIQDTGDPLWLYLGDLIK